MEERTHEPPERLDVDTERGHLIVSEHRLRYLWAAQLAPGVRVLDAGCGTGYGLGILREAGAQSVVGVDISPEAVEHAAGSHGTESVDVVVGDVRHLDFADAEFDLVLCFEVIEHVDERDAILDELARVLSPTGVLCISTPNRLVYPPGNPYHIYEYEPDEFVEALKKRFRRVVLRRQTAWLASAILTDAELGTAGIDDAFGTRVIKTEPKLPGDEIFTIALAAHGELPSLESTVMLGDTFEVRWWQAKTEEAFAHGERRVIEERTRDIERLVSQRDAARSEAAEVRRAATDVRISSQRSAQRLLEVEERLAVSGARVFALEEAMERQTALTALATERLRNLESSVSWRITSPLRTVKRVLRR
jgi:2-polyprenyl-3-methyl-5-hydroxy-6-metoxy-1,4-benzoquinol methylase